MLLSDLNWIDDNDRAKFFFVLFVLHFFCFLSSINLHPKKKSVLNTLFLISIVYFTFLLTYGKLWPLHLHPPELTYTRFSEKWKFQWPFLRNIAYLKEPYAWPMANSVQVELFICASLAAFAWQSSKISTIAIIKNKSYPIFYASSSTCDRVKDFLRSTPLHSHRNR